MRYKAEKLNDDFGEWVVRDTTESRYVAALYDEMTALEAQTVALILNDGIERNWDAVLADYRWQMVEKVNALLGVCKSLLVVVEAKEGRGACIHDTLYGHTWESLGERLREAIAKAEESNG